MRKTGLIIALLALSLSAWTPQQAAAGPPWGRRKHKDKPRPLGFKVQKKGGPITWAKGGPPPWAPAHGYRRKFESQSAYVPPFGIDLGKCNRALIGSVLGGAAGGLVGSTIGKGSGKTAATIGGAIIGIIVGGSIGRSMDKLDHACTGQALEHARNDQPVAWRNPDTSAQYQVKPTKTYKDQGGRYCREYQKTTTIGGKAQQAYGTACRQPDGSWQLVN